MTTGPDLLLTTRGCIIQMESQQEVQAKQNQGATDQISILGGRLRCGSIARVVEAQVGIVGSLHWQQAKNFQNSLTRRTSTSFKWGAKSTWGAYKQQEVSPHWCKKKINALRKLHYRYKEMWKPCALSICTAEISLHQTEPSSSPTAPYAQDTCLICLPLKGSKPQAPSSLPPLQPLRQRAVRGWFGGLKDVICSPKRGWSSLWVEPSGGVFSSVLPTPVWLPVPVWHHLFLQGTGNIICQASFILDAPYLKK